MASNKERSEILEVAVSNIQEEARILVRTMKRMMKTMHSRQEVPQGSSSHTRLIHREDEVEIERVNFIT